jgi:hypothetical protein
MLALAVHGSARAKLGMLVHRPLPVFICLRDIFSPPNITALHDCRLVLTIDDTYSPRRLTHHHYNGTQKFTIQAHNATRRRVHLHHPSGSGSGDYLVHRPGPRICWSLVCAGLKNFTGTAVVNNVPNATPTYGRPVATDKITQALIRGQKHTSPHTRLATLPLYMEQKLTNLTQTSSHTSIPSTPGSRSQLNAGQVT